MILLGGMKERRYKTPVLKYTMCLELTCLFECSHQLSILKLAVREMRSCVDHPVYNVKYGEANWKKHSGDFVNNISFLFVL